MRFIHGIEFNQGAKLKKTLVAFASAGMLIPFAASAELNYNAFAIDYLKTSQSGAGDLAGIGIGITKSFYHNAFLTGSIANRRQPTSSSLGDLSVNEFSEGAGYHTPIQYNVDFVVSGTLRQSRSKLAGTKANENGYALSAGIRGELKRKLEGQVFGKYYSMSSNSFTTTGTSILLSIGYYISPDFQLLAGVDFSKNNPPGSSSYNARTIDFGTRFYF